MSTARGLRRTGRGGPVRTAARLTAVLTAIILLSGCVASQMRNTTAAVNNPQMNYGGNGMLDPGKLPERARQWVEWIKKAGSFCAEATPLVVAGVIGAESDDWDPEANKRYPERAQGLGQFRRGTWAEHGVDADGDGDKDIYSAPDAIVSAGRYLCFIAEIVKKLLKEHKIPGLKGDGNVVDLMIVGYNKGENIWLAKEWQGVPIHFDDQGIPDARDGNGKTGQQYLQMVKDHIDRYQGSGAMGQLPVGEARRNMVEAAKSQIGEKEWVGRLGQVNCNPYGPCDPWCAYFASWVWAKGGMKFHNGAVRAFYNYGVANHSFYTDFARAQPGDTVIFDETDNPRNRYYHIGVIIEAFPDGTITTVEGNSTGGAVALHTRFRPAGRYGIGYVAPVPGT